MPRIQRKTDMQAAQALCALGFALPQPRGRRVCGGQIDPGAGQHGVQTGDQHVPVVRVVHHRQHQAEMAAPLPESPQPQEGAGVLVEDVGR